MKRLSHRRRARWRSASLAAPAGRLQDHVAQSEIDRQHSERLPPAPSDRGARRQADADRVHRRPPRRADAGAARRGRRARLRLAARGDRRHHHRGAGRRRRTSAPPRAPRARSARSSAPPACPRHSIEIRPYPTQDPVRLGTIRVNYPQHGWRRPARAACGRTISARRYDPRLLEQPAVLESRLRHAAQSRRAGRRTRPTSCSRAPKRRRLPRAAPPCSTSTARAKPTATQYPDANKGKISDVGQ